MSFECYECGRLFVSAASRGSHKKWCAGHVEVEIEDVELKFAASNIDDYGSDDDSNTHSFPIPDDEYDGFVEHEFSEDDDNNNENYFFDMNYNTDDYQTEFHYAGVIDNYNDLNSYMKTQELYYEQNFSMVALHSATDFNDFLTKIPPLDDRDHIFSQLIKFKHETGLTREAGNNLLKLIKVFNPTKEVPNDIRSVTRFLEKRSNVFQNQVQRKTIEWPIGFNMHLWSESSPHPGQIELYVKDIVSCIANKFVDPTLQFLYKDELMFNYESFVVGDNNTPCWAHMMTSPWAKHTSREIKAIDASGVLCPVIVYVDGVVMGLRKKVIFFFV